MIYYQSFRAIIISGKIQMNLPEVIIALQHDFNLSSHYICTASVSTVPSARSITRRVPRLPHYLRRTMCGYHPARDHWAAQRMPLHVYRHGYLRVRCPQMALSRADRDSTQRPGESRPWRYTGDCRNKQDPRANSMLLQARDPALS